MTYRPSSRTCARCAAPLHHNNRSGCCDRCSHRYQCRVCRVPLPPPKKGWCPGCYQTLTQMSAAHAAVALGPRPPDLEARLAIFCDRAERQLPLFGEVTP